MTNESECSLSSRRTVDYNDDENLSMLDIRFNPIKILSRFYLILDENHRKIKGIPYSIERKSRKIL